MGDKKQGLSRSQTIGIVWLSTALLLALGALFFYRGGGLPQTTKDTADSSEMAFLTQKEDSLYLSRRKTAATRRKPAYWRNKKVYSEGPRRKDSSSLRTTAAPAARRQPLVVELNSADTLTLQLLHGIGPVYARRIVEYRERLGGFRTTDQLLEVYGFTPELLAHIAPHLTLDTSDIRRMEINSIGLKELVRHPYIEYYQARDIVRLRSKGAAFRSADDLKGIPSMADSSIERLLPYVDFGQNYSADAQ